MQIRKSAQVVADHLIAAERALDEAIRATAALACALPTARLEAKLSAVIGQEAFAGASRAMATLTDARAELVATHDALAGVRDRVGLRNIAFNEEDCPPQSGQLTLVDDRKRA